jgi:hypothetical protein
VFSKKVILILSTLQPSLPMVGGEIYLPTDFGVARTPEIRILTAEEETQVMGRELLDDMRLPGRGETRQPDNRYEEYNRDHYRILRLHQARNRHPRVLTAKSTISHPMKSAL